MTQGLDRVLFVHSSGHEVREVSRDLKMLEILHHKNMGMFRCFNLHTHDTPTLFISQDRHKSFRPGCPHLAIDL